MSRPPPPTLTFEVTRALSGDPKPDAEHHVTTHSSRKASATIRLTVNGKAIMEKLIDSEMTRDFISLLPLSLT